MKEITTTQALGLVRSHGRDTAVSIYLDTNHNGKDAEATIRSNLRDLYQSVEALIRKTYDRHFGERFLQPLRRAIENLRPKGSKGGLAIYYSKGETRLTRLSSDVTNLSVAADSFHIKPLLRNLQSSEVSEHSAIKKFWQASSSGLVSTKMFDIAKASAMGQIHHLLVAENHHVWGKLDRKSGNVKVFKNKEDAQADDLLDDIAELTLLKGGHVTILPLHEMPIGAPIVAILRWQSHNPEDELWLHKKSFNRPMAEAA